MYPLVAHNIAQAALVEGKTKCKTLQMAGASKSLPSLRSMTWAFLILWHASYPQAWDRLDCTCKDEYQWKTNVAALAESPCFRHIKESSDWVTSFLLPRWLHTLRWADLGLSPKVWGDESRVFTITWLLLRLKLLWQNPNFKEISENFPSRSCFLMHTFSKATCNFSFNITPYSIKHP